MNTLTLRSIGAGFVFALATSSMGGISAAAGEPLILTDETEASAAAGYSRAFGRIVLLKEGEEKAFSLFSSLLVFLRSGKTDEMQRIEFMDDGSFYWALKPGEYVIAAFIYGTNTGRLWITFSVPEPGQAVYIGDLLLSFDKSRYAFAVRDRYTEALKNVEGRLAEAKVEPVKGLMRPEGRLGTYKRMLGICAKEWGIECDRTYRGVEPLLPQGTHEGFPTVSSLTPLLEWKPSKTEEVAYDAAVYEAITLTGLTVCRGPAGNGASWSPTSKLLKNQKSNSPYRFNRTRNTCGPCDCVMATRSPIGRPQATSCSSSSVGRGVRETGLGFRRLRSSPTPWL